MAVIIEGPDNAGKSRLANSLAAILHMPIFHAGGPPRDEAHAMECIEDQLSKLPHAVILDRVTPISRQAYEDRVGDPVLMQYASRMARHMGSIVIYCRPPDQHILNLDTHSVKEHDTEEHLEMLIDKLHLIIHRYDEIMSHLPHLTYDWTDDLTNLSYFSDLVFKCITNATHKARIVV